MAIMRMNMNTVGGEPAASTLMREGDGFRTADRAIGQGIHSQRLSRERSW